MKTSNFVSMAIVAITQVIAALMFVFDGATYEKVMIPLFFAVLMCILYMLTDINDKLKPS
jgi:hypothetical protein